MNIAWNCISSDQQQRFLTSAGLTALPNPEALTRAHWQALTEIVGNPASLQQLRSAAQAANLGMPDLDIPEDVGDWSSIIALVAELRIKMGELQEKTAVETTKGQKDMIAEANARDAAKIKESLEKLEKAAKRGSWTKILGWIGVAVGVVTAAVATVATGGAAAPLLAVAMLGLGMMILQETGAMEKVVDFLTENPAVMFAALTIGTGGLIGAAAGGALWASIQSGALDEEQARMAVQITVGVATLALSIAGAVATGGATATGTVAQWVGFGGQIAEAATSAASGALQIDQAILANDAAKIQADVAENSAWLAKLQQMLSEEMDRLQDILNQLQRGVADASDMLTDIADSNRAVLSNMGM